MADSTLALWQQQAIELLLQGKSLTSIAKDVGKTLPELYDARYSLPFAEALTRRQADLRAYTTAMHVGAAREVFEIVLNIARGRPEVDEEGNLANTVKPDVQLKACAMLNERAFGEMPTYTTTAEWAAARDSATKSVLGSLWKLSDHEILDRVRNLKALPSGE